VQSGTPLPYNKIDRYRPADGSYLGSVDLPFVVANDGRGYDLAYLNGYIFVMEGATGMKLWAYKLGDAVSISEARQQGMKVFVWTLDKEEHMEQFLNVGVDGIITNHPDKLIKILQKRFK